jgi:predicted kinase
MANTTAPTLQFLGAAGGVTARDFAGEGACGVAFRVVETEADDDTIKERLQARQTRSNVVSDARLEDFEMLTRLYEPPREWAEGDFIQVFTAAPPEEALTCALKGLARGTSFSG